MWKRIILASIRECGSRQRARENGSWGQATPVQVRSVGRAESWSSGTHKAHLTFRTQRAGLSTSGEEHSTTGFRPSGPKFSYLHSTLEDAELLVGLRELSDGGAVGGGGERRGRLSAGRLRQEQHSSVIQPAVMCTATFVGFSPNDTENIASAMLKLSRRANHVVLSALMCW